jgi:alkylation response protein AidB-like acyl-CoA dehydrogenase
MDFQFTDEQRALKQATPNFARKKLEPNAFTRKEKGWSVGNAKLLSSTGFVGMTLPEE